MTGKREAVWCYTKSLRDKIWGHEEKKETNCTKPKSRGLVLTSLLEINKRVLNSRAMKKFPSGEEQVLKTYEEIKEVIRKNPDLKTPVEVQKQWWKEIAKPWIAEHPLPLPKPRVQRTLVTKEVVTGAGKQ